MTAPAPNNGTPASAVLEELAAAIGRIRFGSVVVQIHEGAVVQIEATEKRRFPQPSPAAR